MDLALLLVNCKSDITIDRTGFTQRYLKTRLYGTKSR